MKNVKYSGCFFTWEELNAHLDSLGEKRLARTVKAPHVTFEYRPDSVDDGLIGQTVTVKVTGYGRNCENEALLVELTDLPEALIPQADAIEVPHITLSVSEDGEPVNSKYLTFREIPPFALTAPFGVMLNTGRVISEA